MRKLKIQAHMTIDGFAARPNGEMDWSFISGPDEAGFQKITDLAATCDTLLIGSKMTKAFVGHWVSMAGNPTSNPQKTFGQLIVDMRKIVFSRTATAIDVENVEVENRDLASIVQALKNEPGKDMIAYGGGEFVSSLISLGLVDEYYILVSPVAIGTGLTIFKEQKVLKLENSIAFKNGKVLNKYLPA
jgi:dihydrofolate reductase